ncbi:hypothetical protein CAEBREN_14592 [Caenorhabditis brenneri]|uniref:Uncharacterized protein n=1 Tax=Caenorhabditis brenneri TaxID=135651 RepID=G0M900_CAEBE|nr:hypothetical protein CAEBREN_14592 [Caenorhabditis brenneri]
MKSSNQTEAAPLNPPRNKPQNAVVNMLNKIDNFNVGGRLVQIYGIYENQYKTSEILGITFYKFIYLIMTTLTLDLHINPRVLYLTDYNSFNMIIASFFGRKLALNIPKYEEKEGIQEEYEEIDLLLECDYPLHTALVICYVSHTMRIAFIREGSGLEFQLRKYEEIKKYYEEIACDIVNTLYYQDEQGRRKMLTALQSTYNHPICAGQKFGTVIETMAVAFKAEAMVFRLIYILMFAYMLCRSPIYSDYDNDRSHVSTKQRNWIEVVPSFYVLSVLSTQFFVNVYEVSKMLWNSIKMRERNNWFHTFGASLKRFYGCKRLSVWRTILLIFLLNLEGVRFVLSVAPRKSVQVTAYTGIWVLVPILLELLYYLLFMITTFSSLRFLSSFKSLGFFSLFIRKMKLHCSSV